MISIESKDINDNHFIDHISQTFNEFQEKFTPEATIGFIDEIIPNSLIEEVLSECGIVEKSKKTL
jgi:hypothetical protein